MADLSPTTLKHPKPVIGLLGGPGSGKSSVARQFAEQGCGVIDADRLAHEALQSDSVRQTLEQWWGDAVIDNAGRVDRAAVGRVVFADEAELKRLESIIHPVVHAGRQRERERHFANRAIVAVVEDCPLLIESGLDDQCDVLVFVDCPEPIRLERLAASRGWDEAELEKREKHQIPLDTKRQAADYVIQNDLAPAQVFEQTSNVLQKILR